MSEDKQSLMTPPFTDLDQENKLIALAYSQAERELEEGTASSQIVTHFLKLGTQRAELEAEQIKLQNSLLEERILGERENQKISEMVNEVLSALRSYMYVPPGATDDHLL